MERYTCLRELLPVIESALAAEGYVVEAPPRHMAGARVTVMTRGDAVISLHEDAARDMADITVYPAGATPGLGLLPPIASPHPGRPDRR